ncbi:MAG: beta-lactamase family protein [Methylobacteriaceae bacterium]|nr:beta-lactamase family protein [Methylobacteriaceae bacterium]MBV9392994.1 beta-lactamase family protein [Methylobacteriaceae bacterium]
MPQSAKIAALDAPRDTPESVGMSSARLQRIRPVLEREIAQKRIPGAVVAIQRHGKLVHLDAIGARDAAAGAPMRTDAIFSVASMTKLMVSVGIMMLYEEGRLLLSDPASKYLPQLAGMKVARSLEGPLSTVPAHREFTIQDLLRHTSGLTYKTRGTSEAHKAFPDGMRDLARSSKADFLESLSQAPLLYQPGTAWEYGLSTDVLGLIIEAITGDTLGKYLHERLWSPLGMIDTSFTLPQSKADRYARAYPTDYLTGEPVTIPHASPDFKPRWESGGGGATSTAADYMRFLQMLLNGGELDRRRYLSRPTVNYMTSDHLGAKIENRVTTMDPSCEGYGFGLGVAVRLQTGIAGSIGSAGDYYWSGVFGTYYWVDPAEDLAVVFMAMAPGQLRLRYRALMRPLVLQAIVD